MLCQNLNDFLREHRNDIEIAGYFNNDNFVTILLLSTGLQAKLISHSAGSRAYPSFWVYEIDGDTRVLKEWFNGYYGYMFVA